MKFITTKKEGALGGKLLGAADICFLCSKKSRKIFQKKVSKSEI